MEAGWASSANHLADAALYGGVQMKHKMWINFIVVLVLVFVSGSVVQGEQQVAYAVQKELSLHGPSGNKLISAGTAFMTNAISVDYTAHIGGLLREVSVVGDYAYMGEGSSLTILDISVANRPAVVGRSIVFPQIISSLAVAGDYAYVGSGRLHVVDVSDPTSPREVGVSDAPAGLAMVVAENYAYIARDSYGLGVIDVTDPTSPIEIGFYDTPDRAVGLTVVGDYAYVADWDSGLRIIDVSDPVNPVEVGYCDTPGPARGVALSGNFAYVADGDGGLRVIDASDPTTPLEVGFYAAIGYIYAYDVKVMGDYAFVADQYRGLQIIDVSDPTNPIEVGSSSGFAISVTVEGNDAYLVGDSGLLIIDLSDPAAPAEKGFYHTFQAAWDVTVASNYAYVTDPHEGLQVIDVSDPTNPIEAGFYDTPGFAMGVAVAGGYAYVADSYEGLQIIDVSDPTNPTGVGFIDTPGYPYEDVAALGNYAYIVGGDGLRVIDVSDPASPIEVGFFETMHDTYGVAIVGTYAYVADGYLGGLQVIDVSDPAHPSQSGFHDTPGEASDVTVSGGYAYLTDGNYGLRVVDVSDPTKPTEVGFYDTPVTAHGVAIMGGYASLTEENRLLRLIDVSDPANPVEVGSIDTQYDALDVAVAGNYAYVADSFAGLLILKYTGLKDATNTAFTGDAPDPSKVGDPIYVTFEVTAGTGVPSGAVTVTVAGQEESCTGILAGGVGGCEITLETPGTYSLLATYRGDNTFAGSSAVERHAVKNDTKTTILSDKPDPSQVGEPITVTFEVTSGYGAPSGSVTVTVAGETESCAGTLTSGLGGCEITLNDPGTYTLAASYGGDDQFRPSSATEQHTVVKGATTTTILADEPEPSEFGEPVTVTFEVSANYGTPSGVVTVTVAEEPKSCVGSLMGGTGECELNLSNPGVYTLIASYGGGDYFLPSSTTEQHTVVKGNATTTILSDEPDPSQAGQEITVIFEVTAESGVPSGVVNVTVYNEAENCSGTLNGGIGECKITLDNPGTYTLAASYQGDDNFRTSSALVEHTVVEKQLVPVFLPLVINK
jgi:hypothetical protein